MKRNFYRIPRHIVGLATLFALALTVLFGGVAGASSVTSSRQAPSDATTCITASPPSQIVGLRHTAWVTVDVYCPPASNVTAAYVQVKWGDGTIEDYPITQCQQVCPPILPIVIDTSHAYTSVGDYMPSFCLVPAPVSSSGAVPCTTAEILVVIQDPPGN